MPSVLTNVNSTSFQYVTSTLGIHSDPQNRGFNTIAHLVQKCLSDFRQAMYENMKWRTLISFKVEYSVFNIVILQNKPGISHQYGLSTFQPFMFYLKHQSGQILPNNMTTNCHFPIVNDQSEPLLHTIHATSAAACISACVRLSVLAKISNPT